MAFECEGDGASSSSDSFYDELIEDLRPTNSTAEEIPTLTKEIHDFLLISSPSGDRSTFDLLEWWKKHEQTFPILAKNC